jgi:hypothetical protein
MVLYDLAICYRFDLGSVRACLFVTKIEYCYYYWSFVYWLTEYGYVLTCWWSVIQIGLNYLLLNVTLCQKAALAWCCFDGDAIQIICWHDAFKSPNHSF